MSRNFLLFLLLCTMFGTAFLSPSTPAFAVLRPGETTGTAPAQPPTEQVDTRPRVLHYEDGGWSPYFLIVNVYDQHNSRIATVYRPITPKYGLRITFYQQDRWNQQLNYRPDRTLESSWEINRNDDSFHEQHFREDGSTVSLDREVRRDLSMRVIEYYRDGSPMREDEKGNGTSSHLEFWPEGDVAMVRDCYQGHSYEAHFERGSQRLLWEKFGNPDGSSEKTKFRYGGEPWATASYDKDGRVHSLKLFNKHNQLEREQIYSYYGLDGISYRVTVKFYDGHDNVRFTQTWYPHFQGDESFFYLEVLELPGINYYFRAPREVGWGSVERPVIACSATRLGDAEQISYYNPNGPLYQVREVDPKGGSRPIFTPHAIVPPPHLDAEYLQNLDAGDWPDMIHPSDYR